MPPDDAFYRWFVVAPTQREIDEERAEAGQAHVAAHRAAMIADWRAAAPDERTTPLESVAAALAELEAEFGGG